MKQYSNMKRLLLLAALATAMIGNAAEAVATRYVDAHNLTVINRPQARDTEFSRLTPSNYPELPAKVSAYSGYSSGLAITFRTDSKALSARWHTKVAAKGANRTPLACCGLDLYIRRDNSWISAGVAYPSTSLDHNGSLVTDMDGTMHECLLYLPLWTTVDSLEIGVDEGATIEALPNPFGPRVVFMGSSITHGVGASRAGLTYPARIERATGWEIPNLGFSGLCKLEQFYTHILADTEAKAFVFDGFSNPSGEMIMERLKAFVDTIRVSHPTEPLIFIQTEVRESGNFNMTKRAYEDHKRECARKAMQQLFDAGYRDIYFIDPGMPLGDDHDNTVEGVHPTDAGYVLIVENLLPQLRQILGKYGIK
jgi:hypothetical protein